MSVAAAELPQMSSAVGTKEEITANLRRRLTAGVRQVAFFIIPTVVGFLLIGRLLVGALYQTGHFGRADSTYVAYVLAGSTIGMLAVTRGRVYNSAFYALHDTTTPLRFATIRVALTAALGYLFAFPFRPFIAWLISGLLRLPAPRPEDSALVFGAVGLTSSAGIAGWIEYLLLRTTMEKRIGRVRIEAVFYLKLWGPALIAGLASILGIHFALAAFHRITAVRSSLQPVIDGISALGVFGVIYLSGTLLLGTDEARRLFRRHLRVSQPRGDISGPNKVMTDDRQRLT
jgi:putative peptidoglycan lipid II flippase